MSGDGGYTQTAYVVILAPLALLMLAVMVLAGRLGNVRGDLATVSRDAARAASQARSFDEGWGAADQVTQASLDGRVCQQHSVNLGDPGAFHPGGWVTATVSCTVNVSDLGIPGVTGTRTLEASSTEVIDLYRED